MFCCSYRESCTHYHIYLSPAVATPFSGSQDDIPRYVKSPTPHQLVETESALVNYIISDTLFSSRDESSWQYTVPSLDHSSGIQLHETYWLPAARKAGIVVLGHGPMSAPGETYSGNWSFLDSVPNHIDKIMTGSKARERNKTSTHRKIWLNHGPFDIVNAAVHFTVSKFLPDVLQVLKSIREEVRPGRRKRLIWASSWYYLPGRGSVRTALLSRHRRSYFMSIFWNTRSAVSPERLDVMYQLGASLDAESMGMSHTKDPWTLFHNMQVFLQNCVLRELLPRHGIAFLPLNIPWSEYVRFPRSSIIPQSLPEYMEFGRSEATREAFLTDSTTYCVLWINMFFVGIILTGDNFDTKLFLTETSQHTSRSTDVVRYLCIEVYCLDFITLSIGFGLKTSLCSTRTVVLRLKVATPISYGRVTHARDDGNSKALPYGGTANHYH
ncbi:hypothetical protein HYDPIDRAFT_166856 [Hydnomerulius pinastri MD-312]|nr:hypothetical protein HYDPIDRAFT_166856 [Hydnomerulius pinastri MD-312]